MNPAVTNCDICKEDYLQNTLINISPEITGEMIEEGTPDLKKDYEYFDGMVCFRCYYTKVARKRMILIDLLFKHEGYVVKMLKKATRLTNKLKMLTLSSIKRRRKNENSSN